MFELFGSALMVVAWLVPDHYLPWLSVYNDSVMALGLLFLVLGTVRRDGLQAKTPPVFWVVVAAAAIPWVQWAGGQIAFTGDAVVGSLYVLGLAISILTGFVWAQRDATGSAALLAGTLLLGSLLSTAIALSQSLRVGDLGLWGLGLCTSGRACANLAQPNNLGTLIGLGTMGLLLLHEQRRVGGWVVGLLLGFLLLGAATTQSRTAMLFGPAILAGLFVARRRGLVVRTSLLLVLAATLLHWLAVWAWPLLQDELLLGSAKSLDSRRMGAGRFEAWTMFIDALSQSPWTGVGWLQTASAQLAVADRHPPGAVVWQHAHNLFLELVLWCGYPLGLLLCGLILFWYASRAKQISSIESVVGLLIVTLFGIHSMLELPYHYAYFLIPIGLWIGHIEYACGAGTSRLAGLRWVPVVLAVAMTAGIWRDYPHIEEDARRVRFENLRIGPVTAVGAAPDAPFLSTLTSFLQFARIKPVSGMSVAELSSMEAVVKRYPYAGSMAKLSWAWALNGRLPEAIRMFNKIRYVHGDAMYQKIRKDMHERVVSGQDGLRELDAALTE
jgi:O-antigen ligase